MFQLGFFALFMLAPVLDIFRYDLTAGHFIVFGQTGTLGLEALTDTPHAALQAAWNISTRILLPVLLVVGVFAFLAWRYGRLYCGWLCPHYLAVESLNGLMRRAGAKPSVWEPSRLPEMRADGHIKPTRRIFWPLVLITAAGFAFSWALVFLTYLLPPERVYAHLLSFGFTRNEGLFLGVATAVLLIEFLFARHLFCRYGCAVGLLQSIVWMANRRALLVAFERPRARACGSCPAHCEAACPMRLKPRQYKYKLLTCTQCGQCLNACEAVQEQRAETEHIVQQPLLRWVRGERADEQTRVLPTSAGQAAPRLERNTG